MLFFHRFSLSLSLPLPPSPLLHQPLLFQFLLFRALCKTLTHSLELHNYIICPQYAYPNIIINTVPPPSAYLFHVSLALSGIFPLSLLPISLISLLLFHKPAITLPALLPMFETLFLIPHGVAAALQARIRQQQRLPRHGHPRRSQQHHHYHGLRVR